MGLHEVEANQDRLEAVELLAGATLVERLSLAGDPSIAEQGEHSSGQLFGSACPIDCKDGEALSCEDGDEAVVRAEPRPQAPDYLEVLGGRSSGSEDPVP